MGENTFACSLGGPHLQLIEAGRHVCSESESYHHSCIEEIGAGQWDISKHKVYMWGDY